MQQQQQQQAKERTTTKRVTLDAATTTTTNTVAAPAKPPRLKANVAPAAAAPIYAVVAAAGKKQLQFKSPLPRREQRQTVGRAKPVPGKVIAMPSGKEYATPALSAPQQPKTAATPASSASPATPALAAAIKNRLAQGCSSLMHACQHGDMVQALAQMRAKPELLRQRDRSNKNALHYCAAQSVDQTGDLVAAASIAIAAPELLESADEDGFTPLHLAVIQGNLAMVNLLLANKADVNAVDNEGHSVVHWATVCGEAEALRAVLAAGASVAKPDVNGGTPLHYAAQMCGATYESKVTAGSSTKLALEILDILLAQPQTSVDVQDKDGRQPLLWAASAGSAKAVIALVKAGARVESADKDGLTALHCAASRGHTECIDTLISLCGAPTDLIDSNGCTALHYAVTLGHADATARLLDLEAEPNRQDRKGRTPAHCGCSKGQFETLKLLKERGANLWLRNAKGDLPLHEAAASGRRELVEWLLEQRSKQVNTTSNDGRSMLHIAAANDYTDMCKLLLDYGADVNALYRNSKGVVLTPLDCSLQRGHRSTAKFLQSQGGLPSGKLRLAARRSNPFHEATADMVRPLKYAEKEELHDLRNSKKYVVYLKRSDSDVGPMDEQCSCAEETYHKEQHYTHTCKRHKRRQLRRRTSSCGESKHTCRSEQCSRICRSKSNIEIRRCKSRERYASSSEWDEECEQEGEDSCENCCYHKRQKQRVVQRKRSTSMRRSKELQDSEDEHDDSVRAVKLSSPPEKSIAKRALKADNGGGTQEREVPIARERPDSVSSKKSQSRPQSAAKRPAAAAKEGTFIKSPPQSAKAASQKVAEQLSLPTSELMELTDEEPEAAKSLTTQVDVHHDAEGLSSKSSEEVPAEAATSMADADADKDASSADAKVELSEEETKQVSKEVEQVIKIAATALSSESKSSTEAAPSEPAPQPPADKPAEQPKPAAPKVEQKPSVVAATPAAAAAASETAAVAGSSSSTAKAKPVAQPAAAAAPVAPVAAVANEAVTQPQKAVAAAADKPQPTGNVETSLAAKKSEQPTATPAKAAAEPKNETPAKPQAEAKTSQPRPTTAAAQQPQQQQEPAAQREQESRRSFTLLPSDSADDEPQASAANALGASSEPERKSSFQVLKSDESGADFKNSSNQVFQIVQDSGSTASKLPSGAEQTKTTDYDYGEFDDDNDDEDGNGIDPEHDSPLRRFLSGGNRHGVGNTNAGNNGVVGVVGDSNAAAGVYEMGNGRKRRLKKRVRSGAKSRSNWKNGQESRDAGGANAVSTTKDQDSGFEPSPRAERTKIPTPRNVYTAVPRRSVYATLDGRSCSSRQENRKPGDKGACDMSSVTRSIQRNIRRYYMERKIFQHLLELKSLQIRSNKLNESVLVKRAVDDYHKSCVLQSGETGQRLRRYNFTEYTFKNFELFLYETLKGLQRPGTYNFQNINEVYEEAERRLSPDYNAYEKALQCTTKTHRCLHAAHAYTGIPCAAYIPMMNHHTMPKFGFGAYKKTGSVSSFYLPKILTSGYGGRASSGGGGGGGCNHKVALELSHGRSKQLISLPAEKLDSNKRYYVTFTVKDSTSCPGSAAQKHSPQQTPQQQQQQQKSEEAAAAVAAGAANEAT